MSREETVHRRSVRSFVTRAGRMTMGQARALEELGPAHLIAYDPGLRDLVAHCREHAGPDAARWSRTILEIGFGMGHATAHIASLMPDTFFLGCEVHAPGVGSLLKQMRALELDNIAIVQHDAVEVVRNMIAPGTLDGIHVFFPDPWPKTRHHKRRLLQSPFVHELALRLKPGGTLHCATDWEDYAEQMLQVLGAEPLLANTAQGWASRPDYRPLTRFEKRGLRLGHGVWDLVFRRQPTGPTGT